MSQTQCTYFVDGDSLILPTTRDLNVYFEGWAPLLCQLENDLRAADYEVSLMSDGSLQFEGLSSNGKRLNTDKLLGEILELVWAWGDTALQCEVERADRAMRITFIEEASGERVAPPYPVLARQPLYVR